MFAKIGWGARIALLYCGFVAIIVTLVVSSYHQHFDLVSANYYADEIAYQKVIDADRNDATLSAPIEVLKNDQNITIRFPHEFQGKPLAGTVTFYSPVNAAWDKTLDISAINNVMSVNRSVLLKTRYTVKIELKANNKNYYQESELNLF